MSTTYVKFFEEHRFFTPTRGHALNESKSGRRLLTMTSVLRTLSPLNKLVPVDAAWKVRILLCFGWVLVVFFPMKEQFSPNGYSAGVQHTGNPPWNMFMNTGHVGENNPYASLLLNSTETSSMFCHSTGVKGMK